MAPCEPCKVVLTTEAHWMVLTWEWPESASKKHGPCICISISYISNRLTNKPLFFTNSFRWSSQILGIFMASPFDDQNYWLLTSSHGRVCTFFRDQEDYGLVFWIERCFPRVLLSCHLSLTMYIGIGSCNARQIANLYSLRELPESCGFCLHLCSVILWLVTRIFDLGSRIWLIWRFAWMHRCPFNQKRIRSSRKSKKI